MTHGLPDGENGPADPQCTHRDTQLRTVVSTKCESYTRAGKLPQAEPYTTPTPAPPLSRYMPARSSVRVAGAKAHLPGMAAQGQGEAWLVSPEASFCGAIPAPCK